MSKRMVDLKVEDGKVASIDGYEIATSGGSGGSGGGGGSLVDISIISSTAKSVSKASAPYSFNWSMNNKLEANKSYDIGYIARVYCSISFQTISVEKNEVCDIVGFTDLVDADYTTLKFGDVVLVLTTIDVTPTANIRDNKYIDINASYYLTYAVVKSGTTGGDVSLDSSKANPKVQYILHRLSATTV